MATQARTMTEDEARDYALQATYSISFPMVLRTTMELGLLDIIAKAGPEARLSAYEITSSLSTSNHEVTTSMIDRIMHLLSTFSIATCSLSNANGEGGKTTRVYGLAPPGRFFVRGGQGTLAPMVELLCSPTSMNTWQCLKESVLEGGVAFIKAHSMPTATHGNVKRDRGNLFNEAMAGVTTVSMANIIDDYKGFEGVRVLVDVAGGIGALLNAIVTKHPSIKGVNFDQPHVIESAPPYEGIQHVGGNMFEEVPNGDAIMLRKVIHDWGDEKCVEILKKCYEALENDGKVIIIDSILPATVNTSDACKFASELDLLMMAVSTGKERREEEFKEIAKAAGFTGFEVVYNNNADSVIELKK